MSGTSWRATNANCVRFPWFVSKDTTSISLAHNKCEHSLVSSHRNQAQDCHWFPFFFLAKSLSNLEQEGQRVNAFKALTQASHQTRKSCLIAQLMANFSSTIVLGSTMICALNVPSGSATSAPHFFHFRIRLLAWSCYSCQLSVFATEISAIMKIMPIIWSVTFI